jgi:Pyrimidine dimer DNA glycosylase
MQTFVPVADFEDSARLLDSPRLGKQRVETLQILRALELPDYGWATHPAVRMWRGRTPALVAYGLAMVRVWRERGFADSTQTLIAEFAPDVVGCTQADLAAAGRLPSWVGDEALHLSHRSNLLAKDPEYYRPRFTELFGPEPDDLPYVWPGSDDVPAAPEPEGVRVWVVRPRAHNELGACLAAGVVGLGTQSGVDVDATGLSPAELRDLAKELSGRRPAKDLRQLSAFLDELRPGDPVGLPIEHGAGLLLGEVVGDYLFQGRELLPHRRPARWDRVVPRSAARPPATLQDPRALFSVVLDPARVPGRG